MSTQTRLCLNRLHLILILGIGLANNGCGEYIQDIVSDEDLANSNEFSIYPTYNEEDVVFTSDWDNTMVTSLNPPDGWVMTTGVWGTDATRETTTALSGSSSVKLLNTAVATKLRGPWFPVFNSADHSACVLMQADSVTAGNTVTVKMYTYAEDRTTLVDTYTLHNAILTSANVWEYHAGALSYLDLSNTARWAYVEISKAAQTFNVYIDRIDVKRLPPALSYSAPTTTAVTSTDASWTTALYQTSARVSELSYDNTTGLMLVRLPGRYQISASIRFASGAVGDLIDIQAADASGTTIIAGTRMVVGGAGAATVTVNGSVDLTTGDSVKIQVKQLRASGSATRAIESGFFQAVLTGY